MCLTIEGRFSGTHSRGNWSSRHSASAGAMSSRERRSVSKCSNTATLLWWVFPEYVASQSLPSRAACPCG